MQKITIATLKNKLSLNFTMKYRKCGNFNSKNNSRPCMGASAFLKSVDFQALGINVKTKAPSQELYPSGHAIWWEQAPKIISTFLESYEWGGKTIIPFCTSGSSPIGSSATNLESLTSGADWLPGRRFSGSASQDELLACADSLNLNLN